MTSIEGTSILPLFLNKVKSDKKALAIAAILEACRPTHAERLWLVGFLKFCGYSMAEVLDLIREHAQWVDYNERITAYQVGTIFHQRPQRTQNKITRKTSRWDLTPLEILKIRRQRSITLSKLLCEENKKKKRSLIPKDWPLRNSILQPSSCASERKVYILQNLCNNQEGALITLRFIY